MRSLGIDVDGPKETCESRDCPFHGNLKVRGKTFSGQIVSLKAQNTAVIERHYLKFIPKYERYERRKKKISAHKPDCLRLKKGDRVRIAECRPISKTKRHVVVKSFK